MLESQKHTLSAFETTGNKIHTNVQSYAQKAVGGHLLQDKTSWRQHPQLSSWAVSTSQSLLNEGVISQHTVNLQ